MSTLEVNKITPAGAATEVTLGESGDTFTLPSGVTLTNNGTASGFGKIGQVIQTSHTTHFQTTSTSFTDVTGFTASITPSSTSSKVLVIVDMCVFPAGASQGNRNDVRVLRGSTEISQRRAQTYDQGGSGVEYEAPITSVVLDSPSTTSSTTYKVQLKLFAGSTANLIHESGRSGFITLMEVLA